VLIVIKWNAEIFQYAVQPGIAIHRRFLCKIKGDCD
jgi:hypothetical protein